MVPAAANSRGPFQKTFREGGASNVRGFITPAGEVGPVTAPSLYQMLSEWILVEMICATPRIVVSYFVLPLCIVG